MSTADFLLYLLIVYLIFHAAMGCHLVWAMAADWRLMVLHSRTINPQIVFLLNIPIVFFGWPAIVLVIYLGAKRN